MVEETTDISNREKSNFVIRWVAKDFQVHEEFTCLSNVTSIASATLDKYDKGCNDWNELKYQQN